MERIVVQRHFPKANIPQLKRVAAYARVSSGKDAMLHSLSAQVSYYSDLIQNHSGWQYAGVYADEALTGTKDNRENFQRLLTDCRSGKVDVVVTKSISRFARNTVTLLETVRELKNMGVDVFFEEQNIHSLSADGELMLTILASYAQEESLSASENQKWRVRKGFENGELINLRHLYGYKISKHSIEINGEEGIPTPAGKEVWQRATVESILRNEKYKGAALLQKKFTVDFLQKKMKVNEGEVPQYYVEHSHAAIIDPEEWEKVQLELARRKTSTWRTRCNSPFAGKLICGDCGEIYGSKVWHSNSKYRRVIWRCNAKYENGDPCSTPHLYEDDLKQYFITALSELLTDRTELPEDGRLIRSELLNFAALDAESDDILREMDVVAGMIKHLVDENATQPKSQAAYIGQYNSLVERYENLQARYDALQQQK